MRIAIIGYGKMGRMVETLARGQGWEIGPKLDLEDNRCGSGITPSSMAGVDVAIEFSQPDAVLGNVEAAARAGVHLVVGTTGWAKDIGRVRTLVEQTGIGLVYGANFSVGMNLFFELAADAARLIGRAPQYDPFLTEAKLPGDRVVKGDRIQVRITPYDGLNEGPAYQSYVMPIPGAPPKILSQPPPRFEALEYRYQFRARDPAGGKLTYSLEKAPAGMTIDQATGLVTWPLGGVKPGDYPVKIVATDTEGGAASQEYTLTLGVPAPSPKQP